LESGSRHLECRRRARRAAFATLVPAWSLLSIALPFGAVEILEQGDA
jgi:hypothetical protein